MSNLTKLKNSDKNITRLLIIAYKKRDELLRSVDKHAKFITRLEHSKKNCKERIRTKRKEQKLNKTIWGIIKNEFNKNDYW